MARGKRSGDRCARARRITVYDLLGYLARGMRNKDILRDFPFLTEQDIRAWLRVKLLVDENISPPLLRAAAAKVKPFIQEADETCLILVHQRSKK
jgi:uncharacterized protein (DUF433 family)